VTVGYVCLLAVFMACACPFTAAVCSSTVFKRSKYAYIWSSSSCGLVLLLLFVPGSARACPVPVVSQVTAAALVHLVMASRAHLIPEVDNLKLSKGREPGQDLTHRLALGLYMPKRTTAMKQSTNQALVHPGHVCCMLEEAESGDPA
jgi:hypothetical protein